MRLSKRSFHSVSFVLVALVAPLFLGVLSGHVWTPTAFAQGEGGGAEKGDAPSQESEASESPGDVATPAPAPKAGATPAAGFPSAAKTPEKKEPTSEEIAKTWHDKTPASVARRVFVGATLGIGVGTGPKDGYSSDRLGVQLFGQYALGAASEPSPRALRWVVESQYAANTGVEVDDDESLSTQAFLAGGGVDFRLGSTAPVENVRALPMTSKDRMRVQAIGLVGVTKTMRLSLETGGRPASQYGANVGVDVRYLHLVSERIEACVGLGARALGYSWYALNFGVVSSF
ncbi:MAG: hypothetical protein IOD12_02360 [Silvanigrellales bacterium]|nr:hypothetical protein [Silvanigrellales bacterium]